MIRRGISRLFGRILSSETGCLEEQQEALLQSETYISMLNVDSETGTGQSEDPRNNTGADDATEINLKDLGLDFTFNLESDDGKEELADPSWDGIIVGATLEKLHNSLKPNKPSTRGQSDRESQPLSTNNTMNEDRCQQPRKPSSAGTRVAIQAPPLSRQLRKVKQTSASDLPVKPTHQLSNSDQSSRGYPSSQSSYKYSCKLDGIKTSSTVHFNPNIPGRESDQPLTPDQFRQWFRYYHPPTNRVTSSFPRSIRGKRVKKTSCSFPGPNIHHSLMNGFFGGERPPPRPNSYPFHLYPSKKPCMSPNCPVDIPHNCGPYYHDGCRGDMYFNGSNPPPNVWRAWVRVGLGSDTVEDRLVNRGFRVNHT